VAVIVSPAVLSEEIVTALKLRGASVTWLDANVEAYLVPELLVAMCCPIMNFALCELLSRSELSDPVVSEQSWGKLSPKSTSTGAESQTIQRCEKVGASVPRQVPTVIVSELPTLAGTLSVGLEVLTGISKICKLGAVVTARVTTSSVCP
jgi:hypothetical protein